MIEVVVGCEHSPLFPAYQDGEGFLTLDFTVMQSVLEWYNSLTKTSDNQAYFLPDQSLFVFPENGEWESFAEEPDGTYPAPDWLVSQPGCPTCLTYIPCDCDLNLLNDQELLAIEASALTGTPPTLGQVRDLVYTCRELQAQLTVEQEEP